jgi:pimeloyl-ACP methyl ester carboxylesterase
MVKKTLLSLAIAVSTAGLTACNLSSTADNSDVATNPILSGQPGYELSSVTPMFQPTKFSGAEVPLNIDILFADAPTTDGTANTADTSPVTTAINKLGGFSTTAAIYMKFSGSLDPNSVVAGETVHLIKLKNGADNSTIDALNIATIAATGSFKSPSQPLAGTDYDAEYVTLDEGQTYTVRILPKTPLDPKTKYVVAFTNGIKSASGEAALPSGDTQLIRSEQIIPDALIPLRTLVTLWDKAAIEVEGINSDNLILSYAFTTDATTDVLHAMAAPGTFLTSQIPNILTAEGAITASVTGQLPEGTAQTTIDATVKATLDAIAEAVAEQINIAMPGTLPTTDGATIRPTLTTTPSLKGFYYKGLITAIADGQGAGIDTVVDKPQSRTYTPIIAGENTPVLIPYDVLLTAQITPKVKDQIPDIATAEISISLGLEANGASETTINATLLQISQNIGTAINEDAGNSDVPIDENTRTFLTTTPEYAPIYLEGLITIIVEGQVAAISSGGAIYQGGLTIPNYLPNAEAGFADTELGSWSGSNDAALALGLEEAPTDVNGEINVTYRFPFADKVGDNTIPVIVTIPKVDCDADGTGPASGKPTNGWPVVIYQHGITVDRTAGVLIGNTLASQCIAMVAIDHAMHGIAPLNSGGANALRLFNVEQVAAIDPITNSPFASARAGWIAFNGAANVPELAALAERHSNVTKATDQSNINMVFQGAVDANDVPVTEASIGTSGALYINLQNFARTRDGIRQTVLDMLNLGASIGDMDVNADGTADDLDADNIYFIGHSLGGIVGATYLAVNNNADVRTYNSNLPKIKAAALGNPGGGFVKLLENSPSIGARVLAGLSLSGLPQGSENIEKFFAVFQATVDSADPINFAADTQNIPVLVYTDVGGLASAEGDADDGALSDQVVPNNAFTPVMPSAKSYLAGTDPLVTEMGITTLVNQTNAVAGGVIAADPKYYFPNAENDSLVRANIRFTQGTHSTFSSGDPKDVFAETYQQIITYFDPYGATKLQGLPGDQQGFVIENTTALEAAAE